jgi:energy-coupling factor transport system ATP-binding protein
MNMSIRLENVNYIYGEGSGQEKWALKNINLTIHDREFIGIVGHTGSGKSTLTQLLNGLEKPSSGTIYYNDEDIQADGYERRKLRQKVGLVFQYPEHQLFEVSVIKDVEFGPRNLGLSNLEVEKRSFDALKQVGLSDDLLDVAPFALSGGQKRRVAIAGVLAMQPEVLILDEPTAGLDPAGRTEILELLKKLHEENNITVILVSHSMDDVARYAGRILVMNQGELVLDGEPQKVFRYRDELRKIGLDVPQSTNILYELRDRGMAVGTEGITPEQAAECIADSLRRQS